MDGEEVGGRSCEEQYLEEVEFEEDENDQSHDEESFSDNCNFASIENDQREDDGQDDPTRAAGQNQALRRERQQQQEHCSTGK